MGFANWTWTGGDVGVSMLIGLGLNADGTVDGSEIGRQGNVVVQLGVSADGISAIYSIESIAS